MGTASLEGGPSPPVPGIGGRGPPYDLRVALARPFKE